MKQILKLVSLLVIYVVLISLLGSCQKPSEEISGPDPESTFTKLDPLGQFIQGIARLDGSEDNVIDNTSCLKVVYPINIKVSGISKTIESADELEALKEQYEEEYLDNPYVSDFMEVIFPFEAKLTDHSSITINDQEELDQITLSCSEGGIDSDTECVDFIYPIEFALYDLQNQLANTREIQDDQSLHFILGGLSEEDLISLNFPVFINTPSGNEEIQSQQGLLQVIEAVSMQCEEDDRLYYPLQQVFQIPFGTISLSITDAPFPIEYIEKAEVTLTKIDIKTGAENDTIPFVTLFNDTISYDLIELTNGITEELLSKAIPAGTYESFRMYVENGSVTLTDGRVFDLKIPSGSQSGIKVKPSSSIIIKADQDNEFLFDFDLSRSFVVKGNPNDISKINGFNFKPVVKVSNTDKSGILTGVVTDADGASLDGVEISIYAADTLNSTTFSGSEGMYMVLGLDPGSYEIQAELEDYLPFVSEDILIVQKDTTEYNFQLQL